MGEPGKKPPDTPASRTWLVSHMARAGLEPTSDTAVRYSIFLAYVYQMCINESLVVDLHHRFTLIQMNKINTSDQQEQPGH